MGRASAEPTSGRGEGRHATVAHRLEYLAFRAVHRQVLARPHETTRAFGARVGRLGLRLLGSKRRLAERNLARVYPDWPSTRRAEVVKACFEHYGGSFCEMLSTSRFEPEAVCDRFEIEGWEILEELGRSRGGFFITSGHFGSWELALYPLGLRLGQVSAVNRPPSNPLVADALAAYRIRAKVDLIEKAGAAHRALNALRRGGRVCLVIDQHVQRSSAVRLPFLGHPAWTSPILGLLAGRTGAPVVPVACEPLDGGRYHLLVKEPIIPRPKEDRVELTARVLAPIEEDIRRRPELWLWMHRRWRE